MSKSWGIWPAGREIVETVMFFVCRRLGSMGVHLHGVRILTAIAGIACKDRRDEYEMPDRRARNHAPPKIVL